MIEPGLRQELLAIARGHLDARVHGRPAPPVPGGIPLASAGVFVTLFCGGDLRGCLGSLEARGRLAETIARLAGSVGGDDRRFAPLRPAELGASRLELSILTPATRLEGPESFEIGRHGLIAERAGHRGLLLPQVATEHGWNRVTFLTHTCLKAGLNGDAWKRDAVIYAFEAEVFGERR